MSRVSRKPCPRIARKASRRVKDSFCCVTIQRSNRAPSCARRSLPIVAAQIEAALARGESYRFTSTVRLSPGGVVLGKGNREEKLGWGDIEQLKIEFGMCSLYKRGEKKPVAHWLFQTNNCMPVCMVIERAVKV